LRECEQLSEALQEYLKSGQKVPPKELLLQYETLSSKKFDTLKESKF
jgi:hypothetical protein